MCTFTAKLVQVLSLFKSLSVEVVKTLVNTFDIPSPKHYQKEVKPEKILISFLLVPRSYRRYLAKVWQEKFPGIGPDDVSCRDKVIRQCIGHFLNLKAVFRLTDKIGRWNLHSGLDINRTVLIQTNDSGEIISYHLL